MMGEALASWMSILVVETDNKQEKGMLVEELVREWILILGVLLSGRAL